jgi:hypothetical protein
MACAPRPAMMAPRRDMDSPIASRRKDTRMLLRPVRALVTHMALIGTLALMLASIASLAHAGRADAQVTHGCGFLYSQANAYMVVGDNAYAHHDWANATDFYNIARNYYEAYMIACV